MCMYIRNNQVNNHVNIQKRQGKYREHNRQKRKTEKKDTSKRTDINGETDHTS